MLIFKTFLIVNLPTELTADQQGSSTSTADSSAGITQLILCFDGLPGAFYNKFSILGEPLFCLVANLVLWTCLLNGKINETSFKKELIKIKRQMKAIVQRVSAAKVTVGEELISSIGRGLCVLVGITHNDTEHDVEYLSRKLLSLRLFEDETCKRWQKSVQDEKLEILCVSQFTLYHRLKGNKPDFHLAMQGEHAYQLYQTFLNRLGQMYDATKIKDGKFGAYMQVHIQNDGPVTLELESPVVQPKVKCKKEISTDNNMHETTDSQNAEKL